MQHLIDIKSLHLKFQIKNWLRFSQTLSNEIRFSRFSCDMSGVGVWELSLRLLRISYGPWRVWRKVELPVYGRPHRWEPLWFYIIFSCLIKIKYELLQQLYVRTPRIKCSVCCEILKDENQVFKTVERKSAQSRFEKLV